MGNSPKAGNQPRRLGGPAYFAPEGLPWGPQMWKMRRSTAMPSVRADRPRTLDPFLEAVLAGRYRIDKLIGRGGMGLVYLAQDTVTDREIVIKLLAPQWMEDRTAVQRFDREGQRLAQLAHPNVVKLYECGHDRGQTFIAMEYLDGEPLRRYLKRRGRLPLAEFTPIAAQILAAVAYAHDRGIMLRDIKPANIMLCEKDGKANFVKLLDFGLAKLVDGDDEETTKSHVIGTAGYLAPEQIKGDPCDVRVDVYAIGVLLYLMLAGETPIHGENDGALLYNHVHGAPKPLGSVLPPGHAVPDSLIALVHQCLEKDPARRPADANEVAEALFESVPPKLFALPEATDESRGALAEYRSSRDRGLDPEGGPPSSEWTKPVVKPPPAESPAAMSASAIPRPVAPAPSAALPVPRPRRGTPSLPPPRRPSRPEIAANSVPPVRMAPRRPTPPPVERTPPPVAVAASTAVSTPRPVDLPSSVHAIATQSVTPMPDDVESGPLPVAPRRGMSGGMMIAAGAVALVLGGICTWAIFGVGTPTTGDATTTAAASVGGAAPEQPSRTPTPAEPKPPVLVPISPAPTQPTVTPATSAAQPVTPKSDAAAAKAASVAKPKKKKPTTATPAAPEEPEPVVEVLPSKAPPIQPKASPLLPTKPPPPPPAPDPKSGPFLPTPSG
jgi:serine/threonine protein kinase